MTMRRAYSVLDVKAITQDDEFVYIEGIASTPTTDRMGDVVEPMGAMFKTPMPLLWQHRHDSPVGHVTFANPTKSGIPFKGRLPRIKEQGALKDRVDEAIQSLQYGLVVAVSIGFAPVADFIERIATGLRFLKWEWLELSLVTIPANADAVITAIKGMGDAGEALPQHVLESIKSIDTAQRVAPGQKPRPVVRLESPGASGSNRANTRKSVQLIPRNRK